MEQKSWLAHLILNSDANAANVVEVLEFYCIEKAFELTDKIQIIDTIIRLTMKQYCWQVGFEDT